MADIISNIKSILREAANLGDKFDRFNAGSVAKAANDQSFQFQCLIDETIPVDLAATVTRNLDRLYASWTQIYLSSIGIIDLNYIKNPKQFIQKYQPRFQMESAEDAEEESFAEAYDESLEPLYGEDEMLFAESFGDTTLAAYIGPSKRVPLGVEKRLREGKKEHLSGLNRKGILPYEEASGDLLDAANDPYARKEGHEYLRSTKDSRAPKMSDIDVKKLNDMQPYVLDLKLLASKGDSAMAEWINYAIGVKTFLHLGNTNMIEKNIVYVLQNRNAMFNFIRWTTGEIKLVRDLILHVDDINFDAANKNDKTGKFIASLKRMKKKWGKVTTSGFNRLAPLATIVISSSTYHAIKENYGYDLKNLTFAHKVMEELFLMCFVIIDDVTHTVDLLVDGQYDYQTYSLETLEREVTMNSNKLGKELVRMMGGN